jgi:hypothetical protein
MLVRKRGVGTQVMHPKLHRPIELTSLYDDLAKAGRRPRTVVISLEVLPATDTVASALGVPDGTEVTSVTRLRFVDDVPLALMYNAVPVDVLRPTVRDLEEQGLYPLLRNAGFAPRMATQVIVGPRAAHGGRGTQLGERRGCSAQLTMTRTAGRHWLTRSGAGSHIRFRRAGTGGPSSSSLAYDDLARGLPEGSSGCDIDRLPQRIVDMRRRPAQRGRWRSRVCAAARRPSSRSGSPGPRALDVHTAMSGVVIRSSACRNAPPPGDVVPAPDREQKSQEELLGQRATSARGPPQRPSASGSSARTRPKRSSSTPLIRAAGLIRVSLAAAL